MSRLLNETDDDLHLQQRGAGRRTTDAGAMHQNDVRDMDSDREFTLSTGTVLGLFFALALVCAVFFGFGYTMGRKSVQSAAEAASAAAAASDAAPLEPVSSKPAAGSPAIQAIPGYMSQSEADSANRNAASQGVRASSSTNASGTTVTIPVGGAKPASASARTAAVGTSAAANPDARAVGDAVQVSKPAPVIRTAPPPIERAAAVPIVIQPSTPVASAASAGAAPNYVQIAAVSHKEDADVLLSALKRRGYSVFTRSGDGDKLIHVQVGPFASKKDAEAMRQKLLGDGYNAILK